MKLNLYILAVLGFVHLSTSTSNQVVIPPIQILEKKNEQVEANPPSGNEDCVIITAPEVQGIKIYEDAVEACRLPIRVLKKYPVLYKILTDHDKRMLIPNEKVYIESYSSDTMKVVCDYIKYRESIANDLTTKYNPAYELKVSAKLLTQIVQAADALEI